MENEWPGMSRNAYSSSRSTSPTLAEAVACLINGDRRVETGEKLDKPVLIIDLLVLVRKVSEFVDHMELSG